VKRRPCSGFIHTECRVLVQIILNLQYDILHYEVTREPSSHKILVIRLTDIKRKLISQGYPKSQCYMMYYITIC